MYSVRTCLISVAAILIISGSCKSHHSNNTAVDKATPDSIILEVCDSITRQWSFNSKQVFIKNIHSKDSIKFEFIWDPDSGKWINYEQVTYVYDDKGNEQSQTYYTFDTNLWILASKSETAYNDKGKKKCDTYYKWELSSSQWIAFVKTEFLYDNKNRNFKETWYFLRENATNWEISGKVENTYDAAGNKILRVDSRLIPGSDQWDFLGKYEYSYDKDNNLKTQKYYYWFSVSRVWANYSTSEYDYHNRLISHFYHHQWMISSRSWFLDNRSTYYY